MPSPSDWLAWQLADSAFPSGGFAHSAGLEAIWKQGVLPDEPALIELLAAVLVQARHSELPVLATVMRDPDRFTEADELAQAMNLNAVAARASRAQGLALLASAGQAFDLPAMRAFEAGTRQAGSPCHLPAVFGGVASCLAMPAEQALALYLFITLRSILSAAVRLGVVGPLRSQAILHRLSPTAQSLALSAVNDTLGDAHQPAPLLDLLRANHDRLYSRLFQS